MQMFDIIFKIPYANVLQNLIFGVFYSLLHTISISIYVIQLFMYKILKILQQNARLVTMLNGYMFAIDGLLIYYIYIYIYIYIYMYKQKLQKSIVW